MSVDNSTVANNYNYNTTNNYYNNGDTRNADGNVTVGTIDNLPAGTTDQDVANAISNGYVQETIKLMQDMIESDPDMDPIMKEFLLSEIDRLAAEGMTDVDPEVQAAVDAQYGEMNADLAQTGMDALMELFKEIANDERMDEAQNVDSDEGSSEAGAGNWLIQLAKALAEVQSKWLDNLMEAYGRMQENTTAAPGADASDEEKQAHADNQKAFIQAQAEVTAYARLFGMASEVTSNVLKSLGDGLTSVARKQ